MVLSEQLHVWYLMVRVQIQQRRHGGPRLDISLWVKTVKFCFRR